MSDFLKSLKTESSSLRQTQAQEEARIEAIRKLYKQDVNPRLQKLYRFLKQVVDHLNFLNKNIVADYKFPVIGAVKNFKQSNYITTVDDTDEIGRIELLFNCLLEKPIVRVIQSTAEVTKLKDFLGEHLIHFDSHTSYSPSGRAIGVRFEIESQIPVQFTFTVEMDTLDIDLDIYNFLHIGHHRITFRPHELNNDLNDRIGKFIVRQDLGLIKLGMTGEDKEKIRKAIEAQKKKSFMEKVINTVYNPPTK